MSGFIRVPRVKTLPLTLKVERADEGLYEVRLLVSLGGEWWTVPFEERLVTYGQKLFHESSNTIYVLDDEDRQKLLAIRDASPIIGLDGGVRFAASAELLRYLSSHEDASELPTVLMPAPLTRYEEKWGTTDWRFLGTYMGLAGILLLLLTGAVFGLTVHASRVEFQRLVEAERLRIEQETVAALRAAEEAARRREECARLKEDFAVLAADVEIAPKAVLDHLHLMDGCDVVNDPMRAAVAFACITLGKQAEALSDADAYFAKAMEVYPEGTEALDAKVKRHLDDAEAARKEGDLALRQREFGTARTKYRTCLSTIILQDDVSPTTRTRDACTQGIQRVDEGLRKQEEERLAEEERQRQREERERARHAWADAPLVCVDGTYSPSCTCGGSRRGCCSRHGGVAGCSQ